MSCVLPDVDQGISEPLDSLWQYSASSDAPIHNVLLLLNWY